MQSTLWRAAMEALSWNAAAMATGSFKSLARPSPQLSMPVSGYSAVTWWSSGWSHSMRAAVPAEKMARTPVLGWNLPEVWRPRPTLPPCPALSERNLAVEPIAAVIDGKAIAQEIRREIAGEVSRMRDAVGKVPGLAVVLVGARKDSETYVRSKKKACEEVGIKSLGIDLPEESSEDEVLRAVMMFNDDPSVHGVLIQLPLPRHIFEENILNAVSIEKDVDGFHPLNIGRLAMQGREPLFVPCTPKGCIELLIRSGIDMVGKKAVVLGRSNIVGAPAAMLLQRHNATVTIVHSYTKNAEDITREADIVISAAGVANLVRGDWLKPGAVVIDVGINPAITVCRAVENITVDADDNSEESEEENGIVEDILDLKIEKSGKNSRRITAKIEVEAPLDAVWNVLTDYERLADFIPGLAVCQLLERRENGARLLQIGEQNLAFGLKFKAKGIVDVVENEVEILPIGIRRDIDFKMVEGDFEVFEGKWGIEQFEGSTGNQNFSIKKDFRTLLSYIVDVQPKKWLPVALVEGRLSREIQINITCVRSQAMRTAYDAVSLF